MYEGLAARSAEERADDVREQVVLLGEAPDVVRQGLAGLLFATLEVPRVAWLTVRALKICDENFPKVCPIADSVDGQELKSDADFLP